MRSLYGILAAFLVVVADQLTKAWIVNNLVLNHSISIVDKYVKLTYVKNPNSVFGISLGAHFPYVLVSITLSLLLIFLILRERRLTYIVAYGLILGGALGNAIDRIRWGEVVDFIDIGISPSLRWAVFNVADASVTVSLIFLLVLFWKDRRRPDLKNGLK